MIKSEKILSRLILVQALVLSLVVFILLPSLLRDTSGDDLAGCTVRSVIEQSGDSLPVPTRIAIKFTDIRPLRILFVILFAASVFVLEIRYKKSRAKDIYYSIYSVCCFAVGLMFLTACLLPFIPLC
ncbi:MAG: hypothetical protein JXL81_06970 [Deltaproteobacteria bacterium]|nr:hypothetical protein [Deltaproteobacteria bacterium]